MVGNAYKYFLKRWNIFLADDLVILKVKYLIDKIRMLMNLDSVYITKVGSIIICIVCTKSY